MGEIVARVSQAKQIKTDAEGEAEDTAYDVIESKQASKIPPITVIYRKACKYTNTVLFCNVL